MYGVTPEFLKAIRNTHNTFVRVEVRSGDKTVLTLYPNDGTVTVDSRNLSRRTLSLSLADSSTRNTIVRVPVFNTYLDLANIYAGYANILSSVLNYPALKFISRYEVDFPPAEFVPETGFSPLSPFGNEIHVWRGVTYYDNIPIFNAYSDVAEDSVSYANILSSNLNYPALKLFLGYDDSLKSEEVPLGVFVITNVEISDNDQGVVINVNGVDRSLKISRNRWTAPYVAPAGNLVDVLSEILIDRFPDIKLNLPSVDLALNQFVLQTGTDPWAGAVSVAEKSGYDLYFDAEGVCSMQPFPDPSTATPSTFYIENEEAMLLGVNRKLTTEYTYNGVILTAEGTAMLEPYRAEAWDDNVNSPTYRYGPFGEVPVFLSSTLLTSPEIAQSSAQKLLGRYTGAAEEISWSQIVNPAHDVYDIVQVQNSGTRINVVLIIDSMSIPLSPTEPMSAKARSVRFSASNVGIDSV